MRYKIKRIRSRRRLKRAIALFLCLLIYFASIAVSLDEHDLYPDFLFETNKRAFTV